MEHRNDACLTRSLPEVVYGHNFSQRWDAVLSAAGHSYRENLDLIFGVIHSSGRSMRERPDHRGVRWLSLARQDQAMSCSLETCGTSRAGQSLDTRSIVIYVSAHFCSSLSIYITIKVSISSCNHRARNRGTYIVSHCSWLYQGALSGSLSMSNCDEARPGRIKSLL